MERIHTDIRRMLEQKYPPIRSGILIESTATEVHITAIAFQRYDILYPSYLINIFKYLTIYSNVLVPNKIAEYVLLRHNELQHCTFGEI